MQLHQQYTERNVRRIIKYKESGNFFLCNVFVVTGIIIFF